MAEAAFEGARAASQSDDDVRLMAADEVGADNLLRAAAYLFVCPENLASMSGQMKEMFDRCYYPVLGKLQGRAYGTIIAAGSDGEGAQRQIDRIATGWRLKRVCEPMIANFNAQTPESIRAIKQVPAAIIKNCKFMGGGLVEGLKLGIY